MRNKLFALLLIAGFMVVAIMEGLPQRATDWVKSDQSWSALLNKVEFAQSLPGPLLGPLDLSPSQLTEAGVVIETNAHREQNGLPPLRSNPKLNLAAKAKLDDMFRQQYFEHESPDGKSPADVIKAAGYEFLVVGENLALGNYQNDQVLVEAWMNSPGHRANILDGKFNEIGVAAAKGMYEGKEVWLAVQEFGTPLSNCPSPQSAVKANIDSNREKIAQMEASLATKKQAIDADRFGSRAAYNEAVAEYNEQARALNALLEQTKDFVGTYNQQVNDFNQCLERNG
jgi:uncharacterized protein YkwD